MSLPYTTSYDDAGEHILHVEVSDGTDSVGKDITITVNDVPEEISIDFSGPKPWAFTVTEKGQLIANNEAHSISNTGNIPVNVEIRYSPSVSDQVIQPGTVQGEDKFITKISEKYKNPTVLPSENYIVVMQRLFPAPYTVGNNLNLIYGAPTGLSRPVDGMETAYEFRAYPAEYAYHSADYDRDSKISGTEANRLLAYWRAGAYHVEPLGYDGYAPGAGSHNGAPHSADKNRDWIIQDEEKEKVLAIWMANKTYRWDLNLKEWVYE